MTPAMRCQGAGVFRWGSSQHMDLTALQCKFRSRLHAGFKVLDEEQSLQVVHSCNSRPSPGFIYFYAVYGPPTLSTSQQTDHAGRDYSETRRLVSTADLLPPQT
jgi:hypothetical protein